MKFKNLLKTTRKQQFDFFGGQPEQEPIKTRKSATEVIFVDPDPSQLYLGMTPLKAHLDALSQKAPLITRGFLAEQDWSEFEARYKAGGKPPYAPRAMMGLILYGILNGVSSLRQLENLARIDLGGMWVSGGIYPDHATIGRFIMLHKDLLTEAFFESMTGAILRKTGSSTNAVAGDGTVIQAACSRYNLLKEEAIIERASATKQAMEADPENLLKRQHAVLAEQAKSQLEARAKVRQDKGKSTTGLRINPLEPDAVVQPQKHHAGYAASYKPSVLANEQRIVLAQTVHPSGEVTILPELLNQCEAISGSAPKELMLDAGYFCQKAADEAIKRDISLLCPEGREPGKAKDSRYYSKGKFVYDEESDSYRCPAGESLIRLYHYKGTEQHKSYTRYGTKACQNCPLQSECTKSKEGRHLKRYESDEVKDALRQVMLQPKAKQRFKQRKAMVEPVFSVLRGSQGLNRFRRKGLAGVKLEFALHILAYNLSRIVAYQVKKYSEALFLAILGQILLYRWRMRSRNYKYRVNMNSLRVFS